MKLIDLLVKKTNEEGWSWPRGALGAHWIKSIKKVAFIDSAGYIPMHIIMHQFHDIDFDETETLVTKSQYESALAASDCWIEWGGGECPVDESANVDIKLEDGSEKSDAPASAFIWQHDDDVTNIIAYRLHKPDINSRANDDRLEQDLNECIGQNFANEWDGEGFPPVGAEFEHSFHADGFSSWHLRKCTAVGKHGVLCVDDKDTELYLNDTNNRFRPLRTEAEKALESAKHIIAELCRDSASNGHSADLIIEAIADGKIPGVKLEVK